MSTTDPKSIALDTFDRCRMLLPKHLAENLGIPKSDPAKLKKKDTDILRLRILPRKKAPLNFWSTKWCFYEIGVGVYNGALTVGGVQFVQFPFQKACGSERYWHPVICILEQLKDGRSSFQFSPASGAGSSTSYHRIYRNKDFPFFPVEESAQDLAWLIQNTLPAFEAIS